MKRFAVWQFFKNSFFQVGSLYLAQTQDRMQYYRRLKSESISREVDCEIVTPNDCKELCSAMEVSDLKGQTVYRG